MEQFPEVNNGYIRQKIFAAGRLCMIRLPLAF
jgi:hypothetical protein